MVQELGVEIYRFSISWPRILPNGFVNVINKAGINYYSNLIDELLKRNITPMVTMYHWELPESLQKLGGWANVEMVDIFMDYAELLLKTFGDRVKIWTTFNEPWYDFLSCFLIADFKTVIVWKGIFVNNLWGRITWHQHLIIPEFQAIFVATHYSKPTQKCIRCTKNNSAIRMVSFSRLLLFFAAYETLTGLDRS